MKFIEKELSVEIYQKHIWFDSQCVLNWINSQKALGTFVENRVKEIKTDKNISFHYISTTENRADIRHFHSILSRHVALKCQK